MNGGRSKQDPGIRCRPARQERVLGVPEWRHPIGDEEQEGPIHRMEKQTRLGSFGGIPRFPTVPLMGER